MRNFLTIWFRELSACFLSPVAYVLMVVFLAVTSATFLLDITQDAALDQPLTVTLFESILVWLTILVTVVCMRLFAEEKRSGTLETLMTVPVTEAQIVLGKYAGALSFLLLVTFPVAITLLLVVAVSPVLQLGDLDGGALLSGGLILILVSSLLVAVGLLVSLLTRNQIIAAICCFCAVWGVLLFGWIVTIISGGGFSTTYVTVTDHIRDFSRGMLDSRPLVFYILGSALFLFASVRVLESRRWR
ncbi:MAG: ABC transporter permease subunit [Verrucomicrobia bacterium]|jgi:ABC-2 type transport system permease protein|nr:ABC transporter permease subunit [Verrucomicrobiota bacterium]MBT7066007.1 ABC transporter permease subunit [Verrucomicrobiota bacterium]MBT7699671.1 ABC transporter permease subunit [Verrucomicrobiota bacterium]